MILYTGCYVSSDNRVANTIAFLREEALQGHLEVTIPDISRGLGISYVDAIRLVEHLHASGLLLARERGTTKRASRFFALAEVVEMCKSSWAERSPISARTKRVVPRNRAAQKA